MKPRIWRISALGTLLLIVTSCTFTATQTVVTKAAAKMGDIQAVKEMGNSRAAHSATLLNDGRVLIVGGMGPNETRLDSAEIFNGSTMTFTPTGKLGTARASHTATPLPDGKVLIAGGYNGSYLQSSEIYDPKTGRFDLGPMLTVPRSDHTATALSDGSVLLAGGVSTGWSFLAEAEVFDPKTGKFTAVGKMASPRESHTATLLQNGKVLITGGHRDRREAITIFSSTELYDPVRSVFEPGPEMTIRRHKHDAVILNDGRVLITGGSDERDARGAYISVEIFDPRMNRFRKVGDLNNPRYKLNGAVVVLSGGRVLVAGGSNRAEVFDSIKGISTPINGSFGTKRLFSTATRLKTGDVLITGGYDENLRIGQQAWIYREV